jgi:hypothetical protein
LSVLNWQPNHGLYWKAKVEGYVCRRQKDRGGVTVWILRSLAPTCPHRREYRYRLRREKLSRANSFVNNTFHLIKVSVSYRNTCIHFDVKSCPSNVMISISPSYRSRPYLCATILTTVLILVGEFKDGVSEFRPGSRTSTTIGCMLRISYIEI